MLQKKIPGFNPFGRLGLFLIALVLVVVCAGSLVRAQGPDTLAQQWANSRVAQEELNFLLRVQQITPAEYQDRNKQLGAQIQNLRVLISKQPRDVQTAIMQQSESLFQVRIAPLRQQWQQQLVEKQQRLVTRDDQIRKEMLADADKAGNLQAARTLLAEKAQRGEISQAEVAKDDKSLEQIVLALQRKYDAYGGNWGSIFSQTVAGVAQKVVADTRLKIRLEDSKSEIGQDAHRSADLSLSMQRNAIFRANQAITAEQQQEQDAAAKAQLSAIQAKYQGRSPAAVDFQDRLSRLVQTGATEQRAQWEADANKARSALVAASRPAARPVSPPSASVQNRVAPPLPAAAQTQNPTFRAQNQHSRPPPPPGYRPTVPLPPPTRSPSSAPVFAGLAILFIAATFLGILGLVGWWAYKKIHYSRYLTVRRTNKAALEEFSLDQATRERNIVEAFESGNYIFKLVGENRNKQYMMRFTLLRNVRAFKRQDLECMRFAYFAFNRGLIDEEKFYTYRITAMYRGGQVDPSEIEYLGLLSFWRKRKKQGEIGRIRGAVMGFAEANCTPNLHNQTFAQIQALVLRNPNDEFYSDMLRRFQEGSRWMGIADIRRSAFTDPEKPTKFVRYLGVLDQTNTMLSYTGEGSIITIAPQGKGKTACNVIPNLLAWPGSAIVLDVKGEIYEKTSKWRSTVGPIIKFSPLDPMHSKCYNPLATIRRESLYVWEDARNMANMIILPGEGGEKNQYFEKRARAVITGIIADMAFWHKPEDRPMRQMLSILNRNGWEEWLDRLRKNPEVEDMRNLGVSLAKEHPETLANIISFALNGVDTWTGERINMITKRSDWHPRDLRGSKHPTIYICINPEDIVTYASLLRVFIAQHINSLMSADPGRDADPILFCLDEFPQLGEMEPVVKALTVGRSYGLRLWLFAQAFSQLEKSYGKSSETLMENCMVRTYMNPNSIESATRISAEIGEAGVASGADQQSSTSPQELMGQTFENLQIVLAQGSKPAKVRKNYYFREAELTSRVGSFDDAAKSGVVEASATA